MQKKVIITLVLLSLFLLACEIPSFLLPADVQQEDTSTQEAAIPTSNISVVLPTRTPRPTLAFTPTKPTKPTRTATFDSRLIPDVANVSDAKLDTLSVNPPVYVVKITGTIPSACHQLKVDIAKPNEKKVIVIKLTSFLDPGKMCDPGKQPFDISLKLDQLPDGQYNVVVNDINTGSFQYP
jgi:hypothetical protein